MWTEMSDPAILIQLGARIKDYRIQLGMKQSDLAQMSCVGVNTVYKIERGKSVSTSLLISILRSLGLLDNLETLIPETQLTPMQMLKLQEKKPKRVRNN
ncbi:MAG: helix-turn-helix domain-containing protein [Bacteroidaceae bacterium]|nr:helix-turn-helix domain-containing protein [Bacteroidaceae bacterium]